MAHRTLIRGTTYEISGGKTLVNGSGYHIAGGKTLVNGTAYEISFGTPASSLAVGSSLYFNVNGVKKEFLVVNQGVPSSSSRYDSSCDGVWMLMKDIYANYNWNSTNNNDYQNSSIHTYLKGTFLGLFDNNIQSAIKQVKIPYVNGTGSGGSITTGTNGLSTKVFLLSGYEVGYTSSTNSGIPQDGALLSFFSGSGNTNTNRIAYLNGTAEEWWLRSPNIKMTTNSWYIRVGGTLTGQGCSVSYGVRPAFVLPSNFDITNYLS